MFLSSVVLTAALLALLHATSPAAHAAPPVQDGADCEALNQEGIDLYYQAKYGDALPKFQEALTCYRGADDRQGESAALEGLGNAYLSTGQYAMAIDHFEQSLAISRDIGDRQGESVSLTNLGSAYLYLGEYEQAINCFEPALVISRETDDQDMAGHILGRLGAVYFSQG